MSATLAERHSGPLTHLLAGDLDFAEFAILAQKASTTNFVVDYIPLREIVEIDYQIAPRGSESVNRGAVKRRQATASGDEDSPKQSCTNSIMTQLETVLGIDLDGDGGVTNEPIPHYNRAENEFHLIITTDPVGHPTVLQPRIQLV